MSTKEGLLPPVFIDPSTSPTIHQWPKSRHRTTALHATALQLKRRRYPVAFRCGQSTAAPIFSSHHAVYTRMLHKSLVKGLVRPRNTGLFGPIDTCASSSQRVAMTHAPERRLSRRCLHREGLCIRSTCRRGEMHGVCKLRRDVMQLAGTVSVCIQGLSATRTRIALICSISAWTMFSVILSLPGF